MYPKNHENKSNVQKNIQQITKFIPVQYFPSNPRTGHSTTHRRRPRKQKNQKYTREQLRAMNDEDSIVTENSMVEERRSSSGLAKLEIQRDAQILELRSLKRRKEELDLKLSSLTRKLRNYDREIVAMGGEAKASLEGYDVASTTSSIAPARVEVSAIAMTARHLAKDAATKSSNLHGNIAANEEEEEELKVPPNAPQENENFVHDDDGDRDDDGDGDDGDGKDQDDHQEVSDLVQNGSTRPVPKRRGRPKKEKEENGNATTTNPTVKKKRGRPSLASKENKQEANLTTPSADNNGEVKTPNPVKRGRGRPRIHPPKPPPDPSEIDPRTGRRRRGRPRKHPETPAGTPKRPRGRPKGSGKKQKLARAEAANETGAEAEATAEAKAKAEAEAEAEAEAAEKFVEVAVMVEDSADDSEATVDDVDVMN